MSRFKIIATRFFFIGCIIFFLTGGIYFSVPVVLEKKLLPDLLKKTGCVPLTCEVRKFSFTGLDIASLRWGNPENPSVCFDSLRIDYSFLGLVNKQIKKIIISGAEIRAEFKDGKLSIPGIDFGSFLKNFSNPGQEEHQTISPKIPVIIGELEIRNAAILLRSGHEVFSIPFKVKIHPVFKEKKEPPSGYKAYCMLSPQIVNILPGVKIKSGINIHAVYDFTSGNFELNLNLTDMDMEYNGLRLRNSSKDVPLTITATGTRDHLQMHFNRFCVGSPFPFELSMCQDASLTATIGKDTLNAEGCVNMLFNKELINNDPRFDIKLSQSASMPFFFKGEKQGEMWRFSLDSAGTSFPLHFARGTETVSISPTELLIKGEGSDTGSSLQFAVNFSSVEYRGNTLHIVSPHVSLEGNGLRNNPETPSLKALVQITDAEITAMDFYAKNIAAKIPLEWPFPSLEDDDITARNDKDRYFVIDDMTYAGMDIGAISATPCQNGTDFHFTGQFNTRIPGFHINFTGMAGLNEKNKFISSVDFYSAEPEKAVQCELSSVAKQLTGMFFDGFVDIKGNWNFDGTHMASMGSILFRNATVDASPQKMIIEGIDLQLTLCDVLNFRSDPDQMLKFQRFVWGDLEANEGNIIFQIESPSSLFLKKSSFSWCGGNVYTHGLHLKSDNSGFDSICYCDRLKLADILKQFHLASAEGEGSVNGRLPVNYKDGKIKINDGFLYSTPGERGILRFDTETLIPGAAGIQKGIQTQIAHEALKNFQYDWAKLSLLSKGEDLHVHLQMEGRPVDLLPFAYTKEYGLVKAEGEPRAHFQGILFNFNFTLPLDEILHYGADLSNLLQSQ
ncbi:MAG: hypothetical protein FJ264_13560 [Planctomycetes bacterium]|nr:hypothetical protein [Planctomycetota bacterium]